MDTLYEKSRSQLESLVEWYSINKGKRNEAATRVHLIDDLLTGCLGWAKEDIDPEDEHEGKYTDYTIKLDRPVLILEAKKEGDYFQLPAGCKNLRYSIKSLCKDNKNLEKALSQVSDYCQKRGVQIGAVCNGWQLVVFIANRVDGIPPLKGYAYVFPSLELMLDKFLDFWDLSSKEGVKEKNIIKKLVGGTSPNLPPKLSSTLSAYPGLKNRNAYQTDLQIISEVILEDVIKDEAVEKDFLKECYCKSGALSQYALISKNILKTRYDYFTGKESAKGHIEAVSTKKGISAEFSEVFSNSLSRRPILLVGDVGVGKTTFINNLIKVEAESIFRDSISLIIDLGSQAVLSEDIGVTVVDEIYNQLLENYNIDIEEDSFVRAAYHMELQRHKERSIYKSLYKNNDSKKIEKEIEFLEQKLANRQEHLRKSIVHLSSGRKQQVVIFIDNCDQRDDAAQQAAFLTSQEIADRWPVTVFVSLRPQTFYASVKEGALSGYHPKVFTIPPPRVDEVIKKRLDFAQKITRGEISLSHIKKKGIKLKLEKLDILIEVLKYSFFDVNDKLLEFIDNISNGNIRQAIDLVKTFLGSGHVNTNKIISKYEESGKYLIPLHEFLRAIIYGDNIYYDPNSSPLTNIFNIKNIDRREHFIMPILLGLLHAHLNSGKDNGFLGSDKVYEELQALGFTIDQIDYILSIARQNKLVENSTRENYTSMIRITTIGIYHIHILCSFFQYIDAIIVDTPILDDAIRQEIHDEQSVGERLKRAVIFKEYLNESWKGLKAENTFFDWQNKSKELSAEIEEIKKVITSN